MLAFKLDSVERLQRHLAQTRELFEVRRDESGNARWEQFDTAKETDFDDTVSLPITSAKEFFFSEREPLYRFNGQAFQEILPDVTSQVLFGVTSCDLVAISYMDQFFAEDRHYQKRRQQTLLVGRDCQSPCENGFCPTVDAGPFVREQTADLILAKNPNDPDSPWLAIASTEQCTELLNTMNLEPADTDWMAARAEAEKGVINAFPSRDYIEQGIERINSDSISAHEWQAVGAQCLSCSGCTSVCPTCSCYDTYEYPEQNGSSVTARVWDSCQFESFQRAAGDTNPSADPGVRSKRFWYHKFSDDYLPEFNRYGCVGCGRCEQTCPGVVGVHTVMRRLAQNAAEPLVLREAPDLG